VHEEEEITSLHLLPYIHPLYIGITEKQGSSKMLFIDFHLFCWCGKWPNVLHRFFGRSWVCRVSVDSVGCRHSNNGCSRDGMEE